MRLEESMVEWAMTPNETGRLARRVRRVEWVHLPERERRARLVALAQRDLPEAEVVRLADCYDPAVLRRALAHPRTPLDRAFDLGALFPGSLLRSPVVTLHLLVRPSLDSLLDQLPIQTGIALLRSDAPPAVLRWGRTHRRNRYRIAVANNRHAAPSLLTLHEGDDHFVASWLALHPGTPHATLLDLFESNRPALAPHRRTIWEHLAQNPALPLSLALRLYRRGPEAVRQALAGNSATPLDLIRRLRWDASRAARWRSHCTLAYTKPRPCLP